jgi:prepilin-type N-terminal cleavage/methylation domain-containing protein
VSRALIRIVPAPNRDREATGYGVRASRRAFSLVELLVVVTIMTLLIGLLGAALSGARTSSKKQQTQLLISKLDAIVRQQFSTYASKTAPMPASLPAGFSSRAAYRSWYIRRNLISGDLPDRWSDVATLASGTVPVIGVSGTLPVTAPQRAYSAVLLGLAKRTAGGGTPTPAMIAAEAVKLAGSYAGAECLFMIVMQGGVANCIDCGELRTAERGDKDGDGAFEFWDAWGNPIGFILWPAGVQLPANTGSAFFAGARALEEPFPTPGTYPSPGLGMRPLIYSAGPDGEYGFDRSNEDSNILAGLNCGNWRVAPTLNSAGKVSGTDYRADNITNLDAEAAK